MANLVPESIRDLSTQTLDQILETRLNLLDLSLLQIYDIDTRDPSVLPYLGEQFHIMGFEGWYYAATDTAKRNLIKSSIDLHKAKGTLYSIRKAFQEVGELITIIEWYNYGNIYVGGKVVEGEKLNIPLFFVQGFVYMGFAQLSGTKTVIPVMPATYTLTVYDSAFGVGGFGKSTFGTKTGRTVIIAV